MGLGRPRFDARWESESDVVFRLGFASSANSIDVRYPFAILAGLSLLASQEGPSTEKATRPVWVKAPESNACRRDRSI